MKMLDHFISESKVFVASLFLKNTINDRYLHFYTGNIIPNHSTHFILLKITKILYTYYIANGKPVIVFIYY